jgi:hypothetical protein
MPRRRAVRQVLQRVHHHAAPADHQLGVLGLAAA